MATWLHDLDALRSLADEDGPVGDWARLQRLGRGAATALPRGRHATPPTLALLPEGLDAWLSELPADLLWCLEIATELGVAPSEPGAWTPLLEPHLAGPHGSSAANILVRLGAFTRAHLKTVLQHDRDDDSLVAWVLASTPAAELDDTAAQIAEGLRDDLAEGSARTIHALELLTPGHPSVFAEDPLESVELGASLAGTACRATASSGSARRRASALATELAADRQTPTAALMRALAGLRKAPALHPATLCALSWEAHFEPSGDPLSDVAERGSREPHTIRAARLAVRDGADAPSAADDAALTALVLETLDRTPERAEGLLATPLTGPADSFVRTAIALRCPDTVPPLLDQPDLRPHGLPLASLTPTLEVLERLLQLPVPADADLRFEFAGALVQTADRAALPTVKALLGHLRPNEVSEIRNLARSIFNEEI